MEDIKLPVDVKFSTMEILIHFTASVGYNFLLKIGVLRAEGITKNRPQLKSI